MRRPAGIWQLCAVVLLALAGGVRADVILTAENLNVSLKHMQRLRLQLQDAGPSQKPPLLFQLGDEADSLALLFTNEVIAHGRQQEGLINLGLKRAGNLDVKIEWLADRERYLYDGAAFRRYLDLAPDGARAAESAYRLVQIAFYRADADDARSLQAAAQRKRRFLDRFPGDDHAPEVAMMLAIDYRDLWRHYRGAGAGTEAARFQALAREQFHRVAETYTGSDEAEIARRLLRRFEDEVRDNTAGGADG